MEIPREYLRIAKVVGENEDGLTLFVPKDLEGVFHLTDGDSFLTLLFVKHNHEEQSISVWVPWEQEQEQEDENDSYSDG